MRSIFGGVARVERVVRRAVIAGVTIYASWLGMLAIHELGHVIHAWLSGGRVVQVIFPLLGFSQTIVWPNPRERFVVWGGPIWGALLPVAMYGAFRIARRAVPEVLKFFAGFCLIANGAYLACGWLNPTGDAGELRRLGTPVLLMVAVGAGMFLGGLLLWHRTQWLSRNARPATKPRKSE